MNGAVRVRLRIGRYLVAEAPGCDGQPPGFAVLAAAGGELQRCATYGEAVHAVVLMTQHDAAAPGESAP